MSDKRCETCMYLDLSTTSDNGERAACRVHAPIPDAKTEYGVWPMVGLDDWCGVHRPAPEQPTPTLNDDDLPF